MACGAFGSCAVTALTAQNTHGVHGLHPVPLEFLKQQIDVVMSDIGTDAIKVWVERGGWPRDWGAGG